MHHSRAGLVVKDSFRTPLHTDPRSQRGAAARGSRHHHRSRNKLPWQLPRSSPLSLSLARHLLLLFNCHHSSFPRRELTSARTRADLDSGAAPHLLPLAVPRHLTSSRRRTSSHRRPSPVTASLTSHVTSRFSLLTCRQNVVKIGAPLSPYLRSDFLIFCPSLFSFIFILNLFHFYSSSVPLPLAPFRFHSVSCRSLFRFL